MHTPDNNFPQLGYGLGFRPAHFSYIKEHKPDIDWFEIISENYMDTGGKEMLILLSIWLDYLHTLLLEHGMIQIS